MKKFGQAVSYNAADEASTASALRDRANELEGSGDYRRASVYHNAAAKAEDRADLWRGLLGRGSR
ncbi:hypothetical protein FHU38_001395 [Saccharomonospora amisosensis]|uniref:Uncharacterized protein n=1 Tax=Saccharomonospora amisosensis TaxID=1128677 RepID=A0A7X5ZQ17_9PSEU|nr:hypothetical protein [Saccharomonospora amisosensis]NIJ11051.1 hypothetical protein [Saccharomonospora amisosensis]